MNNEELKKKIENIVAMAILEADELPFVETAEYVADAIIAAVIGYVKEEEHRADKAEQLKNQYCRALLNLARRYVVKTNMTLPPVNESNSRSVDIEMLALYIMANECEQAEKELAEEGKE